MKHKTTQTIYAYWNDVRRDRIAPLRLEIQPSHIAELLPDTFILERTDVHTYRFRLAGTRVCTYFGMEMRGFNFLDIWSDSDRDMLEHHFAATTATGRVTNVLIEATFADGQRGDLEFVILPLVHTGKSIDRLLGSLSGLNVPQSAGRERITSLKVLAVETVWPDGSPQARGDDLESQVPFMPEVRNARIVRQDRRQFRVYDGGLASEPRKL